MRLYTDSLSNVNDSKAFIYTHKAVSTETYESFESLTDTYDAKTKHFFKHVLICAVDRKIRRESIAVPVPAKVIEKEPLTRSADWRQLEVDRRIENVMPYSKIKHECREFVINEKDLKMFIDLELESSNTRKVNFFTGKPTERRPKKAARYDSNRNPYSDTVCNSLDVLNQSVVIYNKPAMEDHLAVGEEKLRLARLELERLTDDLGPRDEVVQDFRQTVIDMEERHTHEKWTRKHINERIPTQIDDLRWFYNPSYRVGETGRVFQLHGVLQNATREMKQACWLTLDDFKNYDLVASQPNILRQFFEEAGIDSTWLKNYVEDKTMRARLAAECGLTIKTFKTLLLATVMGAMRPSNYSRFTTSPYFIELRRELKSRDKRIVLPVAERFLSVIEPLPTQLAGYYRYVSDRFAGRVILKNACGMTLNLDRMRENRPYYNYRASLMAFFLQGAEAKYIHRLVDLSMVYGYQIISVEHDGLVVRGVIPEQAQQDAKEYAGLKYAELTEKEFVN